MRHPAQIVGVNALLLSLIMISLSIMATSNTAVPAMLR